MTEKEAIELINLLKELVNKQVYLPQNGMKKDILLKAKSSIIKKEFIININRGSINVNKCSFVARTKGKNELLLRLDVNPTSKHKNPDGEIIQGTHMHIFKEDHEINYAIPFNVDSENLIEACIAFFNHFNVIENYTVEDISNYKLFN